MQINWLFISLELFFNPEYLYHDINYISCDIKISISPYI